MRFRLVPKSMTLDDLERPFRTLFQNTCVFWTQHENLNEDRPILSAAKMSPNDCSFWQHKVYADIRRGYLETGRQTTVVLIYSRVCYTRDQWRCVEGE